MQPSARRVVVVGSLNVDYIATVQRLPAPGQTIVASGLISRFGGKGANQALAAARQGAVVSMIGSLGDDEDGRAYFGRLRAESIDVKGVKLTRNARTGTALIAVDATAENMIIVAAGANAKVSPREVEALSAGISRAAALLVQFELPLRTVKSAIACANRAEVPVVLNPSPLRDGFPWGEVGIGSLITNAGEARQIFELSPGSLGTRRNAWRRALEKFRIRHLIITRGAQPTLCLTAQDFFEVPTLKVKAVDSVGAGDAFAGVYTARRAEGLDLFSSVRLANCAGALTTLKRGAQEAIPDRAATERAARRLQRIS